MVRLPFTLSFLLLSFAAFSQSVYLDPAFDTGTGLNDWAYAVAVQTDGKILVGGDFVNYNGTPAVRLVRLHANGTVDNTFAPDALNNSVRAIAVQPDGKILIGGIFTTIGTITRDRIARLNPDGSVDAGFDPGTGFNFVVRTLAIQPDGRILAGGDFTTYNGINRNYIARLHANGNLDTTFNVGTGFNNAVHSAALQPDGKVVVGGTFSTFSDTLRSRVARLNADGSLDASFDPGTGINSGVNTGTVYEVQLQSDGKVMVGGNFSSYNGVDRSRILRLHPDGALDLAFDPGMGFGGFGNEVRALVVQPNGKVVAAGSFASYNGTPNSGIARINGDGSVDAAFDAGTGFNNYVYDLALQIDGKIIAVGASNIFNDTAINYIARLTACVSTGFAMNETACGAFALNGQTYTASGVYQQTFQDAAGCDSTLTLNLTVENVDTSVTVNANVLLASAAGASYQWLNCDNGFALVPGATGQSFPATWNGSYAVVVTQNGCVDTSACFQVTGLTTGDFGTEEVMDAYPNPVADFLNVVLPENGKPAVLRITSVTGTVAVQVRADKRHHELDLRGLAPGLYFLEAIQDGTLTRSKLIKH